MNGNTTLITRAADAAVARGIIVCNAAGNDGSNTSHNTLGAPADGDSVLTVGALGASGNRASYSSVGPTTSVPPRIKPDVMAQGSSPMHASESGITVFTTSGSGTSYACPIAAGVALAQTGAAKVEAQHRKSKTVQGFHGVEDDLVMQGSAEQRMRMAYKRGVRGTLGAGVEQGFQASGRTVEKQRLDGGVLA